MTLQPNVAGIPVPRPTALSSPYWDGCVEGVLRYQRCGACDAANFGPGVVCSSCRSGDLTWQASAGAGELYSWTVVGRPPVAAFATPYAPAIVRLDEGYDMVSAVIGCEVSDLCAGMRLGVEFHRVTDEISLPFFSPTR